MAGEPGRRPVFDKREFSLAAAKPFRVVEIPFVAMFWLSSLSGCSWVLSLSDFDEPDAGAPADASSVETAAAGDSTDSPSDVVDGEPGCDSGTTGCSGTCVDTANDPGNCGSCGISCQGANAICEGGSCKCVPTCVPANGCGADGCEGSCGSCELGLTCWQGYCVREWPTTGAWNCYQKCGGNTAADPSLTCVGSLQGSCDDHETTCYCWCGVPGTCSL